MICVNSIDLLREGLCSTIDANRRSHHRINRHNYIVKLCHFFDKTDCIYLHEPLACCPRSNIMKLHQINLPNRIVEYHPCDTWHNLISSNRFRIALNHPDHLQLYQLHASVTITILSSFYKSVSSLSPHVLRTGQAISL